VPLRWGILIAALVTFIPVFPLFALRESREHPKKHAQQPSVDALELPGTLLAQETAVVVPVATAESNGHADSSANTSEARGDESGEPVDPKTRAGVVWLFARLLIPDTLYTAGSGAALALL